MDLFVDDDAYVRAPVRDVYPTLTDIAGWAAWWPGIRTTARSAEGEDERWLVTMRRRGRLPAVRFEIAPHAYRHDAGFKLTLSGQLQGEAEFWFEEGHSGVVVHHLVTAQIDARRPLAVAAAYRASFRAGTWGLKDRLQADARRRSGLPA